MKRPSCMTFRLPPTGVLRELLVLPVAKLQVPSQGVLMQRTLPTTQTRDRAFNCERASG